MEKVLKVWLLYIDRSCGHCVTVVYKIPPIFSVINFLDLNNNKRNLHSTKRLTTLFRQVSFGLQLIVLHDWTNIYLLNHRLSQNALMYAT